VNGPVVRRIGWELRVRFPLIALLVLLWGFALVALFATADDQTRTAGLDGNIATAFRLTGLDPLAAWTVIGQTHPILLVACFLFIVGLGVRAVAGELEAGSLDLTLARPISRRSYLASHLAVLVPGTALLALAYAAGTLVADRVFDPPGPALESGRMLLAAVQVWLLFLAVGALTLLVSALMSERGRALGVAVGVVLVMYVGNFLFALWEPLRFLTRITLFRYFTPGPTIQAGDVAWGDSAVLAVFTAVALVAGFVAFERRDLTR
jgi:ABC-2 type transport system permease protein